MSLRSAYRDRLQNGGLKPDAAQASAVESLARLEADLNAASEPRIALPFARRREPPRGAYLFGPVGRGKSMLMDMFFDNAPTEKKRRVHFHAFMAEVHALVDAWRKSDGAERRARFGRHKGDDPVPPVAEALTDGARLLCFDELQVTDIADAMILGRLFEAMWARGVVLVATSNRHPDELYKDGLNRQLFLPAIDAMKARMELIRLAGPEDHRLGRLRSARTWFAPLDRVADFDALWRDQTDDAAEQTTTLDVLGRRLALDRTVGGLLRAPFERLCASALGPQDYLAVAGRFHTVFLEGVPRLSPDRRNEARRLVTLIDALYEARTKLVVLAAAEPDQLYPAGDGAFEFERTVSRLQEMRSEAYLAAERS